MTILIYTCQCLKFLSPKENSWHDIAKFDTAEFTYSMSNHWQVQNIKRKIKLWFGKEKKCIMYMLLFFLFYKFMLLLKIHSLEMKWFFIWFKIIQILSNQYVNNNNKKKNLQTLGTHTHTHFNSQTWKEAIYMLSCINKEAGNNNGLYDNIVFVSLVPTEVKISWLQLCNLSQLKRFWERETKRGLRTCV